MILLKIMQQVQQIMDFGLIQKFILQDLQQVLMYVPQKIKQDYLSIIQLIQQEDMALEFFMK
jgi:hypothetical protein